MRTTRFAHSLIAACGLLSWAPSVNGAPIELTFDPEVTSVLLDEVFTVDIYADLSGAPDPITAWGLDLVISGNLDYGGNPLVSMTGIELGSDWDEAFATDDSDGLAGMSLLGVTGTEVHLATVTLTANSTYSGTAVLGLGASDDGISESFFYSGTSWPFEMGAAGFDVNAGTVILPIGQPVPEPATISLLLLSFAGIGGARAWRRRRRV